MRPRDRAALILVTLALAFACLAIGGAPRWAACIAAGLCVATAIPYVTSRRTATRPALLLLPLAVMATLSLLQLVPIPIAIADIISPMKATLVRENARAWGDAEPTWVVASFDGPATLVELAKLSGYLVLAWTCVRLASERHARRWLVAAPVGVASLVAIVTLAHSAVGTRKVYGVYQTTTNLDFVGPLVSANHLASLLSLAVPLAGSLALQARGRRRGGWFALAALLLATTMLSGSRGGVLGLVAGLTVMGAFLFVRHRAGPDDAHPTMPAISAPIALAALASIAALAVLTAGDVSRDLSRTSLQELHEPHSKYQVWVRAAELTADFRWAGVGKGGFESAFTPYSDSGTVIYSHAENGYLQAVVDWGVPGAALLFLSLATAAVAGLRRWRNGVVEAGVLGALATLAVHDVADFSIELPAVAMSIIAASAVLFPERLAATRRDGEVRAPRSVVMIRAGGLVVALGIIALAASQLGRNAFADYERVTRAPAASRVAVAHDALSRHPGSYLIAGRAAEALFAQRDPRALKLIARSLSMNSNHAGLRHIAARMLVVSSRPQQAAGEFAAAARLSRDVRPIVADVVAAYSDPEQIARALPTETAHAAAIIRALSAHRSAALAFARRVGQMHPRDADVQALLADAALEAGDGGQAVDAAQAAWKLVPSASNAVLLGRALGLSGESERATAFVIDAIDKTMTDPAVERVRLFLVLSDLLIARGDLLGAKAALERGRDTAGSERNWLVLIHSKLAEVEERLGNRNQAAWERQRAAELEASLSSN